MNKIFSRQSTVKASTFLSSGARYYNSLLINVLSTPRFGPFRQTTHTNDSHIVTKFGEHFEIIKEEDGQLVCHPLELQPHNTESRLEDCRSLSVWWRRSCQQEREELGEKGRNYRQDDLPRKLCSGNATRLANIIFAVLCICMLPVWYISRLPTRC